MGTRGLIGIRIDGKLKATYNHFDSYPSGLGVEVVEFCRGLVKENMLDKFAKQAKGLIMVDEHNSKPTDKTIEKYKKYSNTSVSNQDLKDWYCLLREVQGIDGFKELLKGSLKHMIDSADFLDDSLFCEYAYIINLDANVLEFYEGFNVIKTNHINYDEHKRLMVPSGSHGYLYGPCKLVGIARLEDIPEDWEKRYYPEKE